MPFFKDNFIVPSCLLSATKRVCMFPPTWGNSRFSVGSCDSHGVARAARKNMLHCVSKSLEQSEVFFVKVSQNPPSSSSLFSSFPQQSGNSINGQRNIFFQQIKK